MTPEEYESLPSQTQDKICEEHGVPMYSEPSGGRACPFCENEEWEAAS